MSRFEPTKQKISLRVSIPVNYFIEVYVDETDLDENGNLFQDKADIILNDFDFSNAEEDAEM